MKKFTLFLSAMLISLMSFAQTVPTNEELLLTFKQDYLAHFNITDATDTDLNVREAGNFIYVMNSKGGDAVKFITENANWKWLADYIISVAAAIPEGTNEGYYWRANLDAFFHCKNAVAVGGVNSADFTEAGKPENWGPYYLAAQTPVEPEIEWIPMELEISNLTTMEMPVEGVTYLQLTGRDDKEDADVMLFLNNYTRENKAYEVNVGSSYMTFGGSELTVIDGSITQSVDPELGDTVYAGIVHASVGEEGETMYVEFTLKMYALEPIEIELEDVEIVVNEESAIAFFNATWEGSPLQVEVSDFEEVEFKEYPECWLSIGDDVNGEAAAGPAAIIIEDGVAMLEGEFVSNKTGKTYEVMLSGKLPVAEPEPVEPLVKLTGDEDIYHFYLSQGVAVNTNPASPYYGYTYVTAATDGAADGGSDRADTQKRGIFVYDKELACLNPSNAGFLPANATALMTDVSRQAMHRIAINPVNDHVVFCYNVEGASAVWSMDPANLAGDATNLIEGLAITKANAICFDEKGTLYVMDNANTSTGGTIVKVVNGELITVAQDATWGVQDISLASDGRGGLWVAQNRWNVDVYAVLSHVNAAGEIDFKVTKDSPEELRALFPQDANASYRGQCAYDAENHVLAFGGNKVVSLFKVYYDVITGVPSIEKLISTPAIGSNIDGVAFYDNGDFAVVSASAKRFMKFACNIEIPVQAPLKGIVKRALTVGESTVVLTHEADGTPHIYNIKGEKFAEVSQVGVVPVDTANAGDYLAISDIAVTEDGKLVGVNYIMCQSGDEYVDEGYKRGENRFYIWNDLAGDPTLWFSSKMSSNWFRSKQGYTMALKGNSTNCQIILTGPHGKSDWGRFSIYNVIEGQYVEPDVNNNDYYHFHNAATDIYDNGTVGVLGENYQLNASPLTDSTWILDGNLVEPYEIIVPETNNVALENGATLSADLGKKFNGATILKEGEQVLMVAPYADADGKLAGVKVLDITDGLAADSVVATLDLDAPVEATAAATAVEVAAYDANITLVADGFIYNLVHKLPKPERTETTVLNPFAYNLSSTLSEEGTTLTVNYTLNANADAVEVVILSGEEVVKTIPCKGINKGTYTVEVSTAGLPQDVDLTWSVNVKGTSVEAPTQEEKMYSLYCPHGLAIDKDPESEYFGRILVAEAMQGVPASGYVTSGKGAGLYVFNPSFTTDSVAYKGGNDFTRILASNGYQPWRVKISEDGRIFVSSLDLNGVAVWEVSKDLQTWTPVIAGTNDATDYNIYDAEGNFIAGLNCSMDVIGKGDDLKLLLYSTNNKGIAFNQSGYRLDEYALGTATTWTGTPKNIINGGAYGVVHTNVEFIYDGEGGYWFGGSRAGNAGQPNLVHINAAGEQDYYTEDAGLYGGDGVLVHNGMLFKGKARTSSTVGNFGVWTIGKDADGKVTLTEKWTVAANGIGRNLNEFAVDYAENLYVVGNSGEKIIAYAMPYSGEVSTPAASKYAFTLESEPNYMTWEDEITNLVIDYENMAIIGGPSTKMQVEVYLGLGQDNGDGTITLTEESSVSIMGFDARFIDGYVYDIDPDAPAVKAVLHVEDSGFFYEFKLNMTSAAPADPIVVVVEDATVQIDTIPLFGDAVDYALKMTANWTDTTDNTTYPVLVEVPVYYPEATEPSEISCTVTVGGLGDDDPWLGSGEGDLIISTVDGVVTAKGIVSNPYTGVAFDVTVSGKLPVEEPVKYTVTATVNPAETGTVTGAGEYEEGAEATLTATAAEGYEFVNWTVAGAEVATTATYTFTVTADVEVVANFKEITDAVDNIQVGVKATKVLRNGQLIIIKNDVEYNAQGAVVK